MPTARIRSHPIRSDRSARMFSECSPNIPQEAASAEGLRRVVEAIVVTVPGAACYSLPAELLSSAPVVFDAVRSRRHCHCHCHCHCRMRHCHWHDLT